jgi:hypothetical protein
MSRVAGHSLEREGAAYVVDDRGRVVRQAMNTVGGYGRALCSCGQMSDMLGSGAARKAWHREHKAEVSS